ncbi:MAG: Ig-like domain-containing protein [bacterium]|nr:Ig-like domain-containing protein [bacterium]
MTLAADDDTLFADNGASSTQVRARVRTENNNPVGGVEVEFSTSRGVITSPAVTDAQSGTAIVTLTSTESIGMAMVIARYNDNADTVFVNFLEPYEASAIQVNTSLSTMSAGVDSSVISARVIGEDGQTLQSNVLVTFTATAGSFSAQAVTTSNGIATTLFRAPVTAGDVTIAASTGTATGSTTITVTPGALASLTLEATDDSLWADNSSETSIRALARDTYGNPALAGTIVSFSAIGGTISTAASTDAAGYALATFRAGLNTGNATITALNGTTQGSTSVFLRPTDAAQIALTVTPRQLIADGQTTAILRAQVVDSENRPVSNGTVVTFTSETGQLGGYSTLARGGTSRGWKSGSSSISRAAERGRILSDSKNITGPDRRGNPMSSIFSAVTEDGYAVATLTSATTAGNDLITATTNGHVAEETATYTAGTAASVDVTPGEVSLPADGVSSTQVVCRVYDAYGNPLRGGIAVALTATLGTLSPASGFTNAAGTFTTNSRPRARLAIAQSWLTQAKRAATAK